MALPPSLSLLPQRPARWAGPLPPWPRWSELLIRLVIEVSNVLQPADEALPFRDRQRECCAKSYGELRSGEGKSAQPKIKPCEVRCGNPSQKERERTSSVGCDIPGRVTKRSVGDGREQHREITPISI